MTRILKALKVRRLPMKSNIDLAVNVNYKGMPERLASLLKGNLSDLEFYPDQDNLSSRRIFSNFFGVKENEVIVGNGCSELLFLLPSALNLKKALVIVPTFWEYAYGVKESDGEVKYFFTKEEEDFKLDFDELGKEVKKYEAIYVCNTNNPTSVNYEKDKLIQLIKKNKNQLFIIDETYLMFDRHYNKKTLVKEAAFLPNLVVVASFSKIFCIPGLRIGFGIANKKIIEKLIKKQIPYKAFSFTPKVIVNLLENKRYLADTRNYIHKEGLRLYSLYGKLKILKVFKPSTNFILCKIMIDNLNATSLTSILKKRGILIRDCTPFEGLGNKWIRFSISKKENNNHLFDNLKKIE